MRRLVGLENPTEFITTRIFPHIIVSPAGCWEWQRSKDNVGYGTFKDVTRKTHKLHRLMYQLYKGSIPEGMLVCHTCDNPACCNPDHLWVGTQKDNIRDCVVKGRRTKTHCPHGHEFTPENTYTFPDGRRQCRKCKKVNDDRQNAKKRLRKCRLYA